MARIKPETLEQQTNFVVPNKGLQLEMRFTAHAICRRCRLDALDPDIQNMCRQGYDKGFNIKLINLRSATISTEHFENIIYITLTCHNYNLVL